MRDLPEDSSAKTEQLSLSHAEVAATLRDLGLELQLEAEEVEDLSEPGLAVAVPGVEVEGEAAAPRPWRRWPRPVSTVWSSCKYKYQTYFSNHLTRGEDKVS